jgi:hypothetical protein
MDYDKDKVDEAALALLYLTLCGDKYGARAWKSHDWGALDRLHEKGYIDDPKNKTKSVAFAEEARAEAEELFRKLFGKRRQAGKAPG